MKLSTRLLIAIGFVSTSVLGGMVAILLAPDPAAAAQLGAVGLQAKITALPVPYSHMTNIQNDWMKITDVGIFNLENSTSVIEVTYQGIHSYVASPGVGGGIFEIRVDDILPLQNTGHSPYFVGTWYVTYSGYWQNLSLGEHLVSIWVKSLDEGKIGEARLNYQSYSGPTYPLDTIIVKEYFTITTTYLPSIHR